MLTMRVCLSSFLAVLGIACSSAPAPQPSPAPVPAPKPAAPPPAPTYERGITPRPAPPLPAIAPVDGPLNIVTAFPKANDVISVRDSNFIFGVTGNGRAALTINGAPVPVAPNGTFLAYLPVPPPTAPRYELVARTATDSSR